MQEASDRGFFRPEGVPSMPFILQAARDIASGLSVLHARNVVHGDLTGGNVLLTTDTASPSHVLAKVADFGLARTVDVQSKIETRTYGTVTHMPPELLAKGIFSKASVHYAHLHYFSDFSCSVKVLLVRKARHMDFVASLGQQWWQVLSSIDVIVSSLQLPNPWQT